MAITVYGAGGSGAVKHLYGLSSDTKPTVNMPVGSEFVETDTGIRFTYSGSVWFATSAGGSGQQLAANSQSVVMASDWVPPETPLAPGENYVGKVGGNITSIYKNLTTSTALHNAGDVVGGKLTFTNIARTSGGAMRLKSLFFFDVGGNVAVGYRLYYFDSNPTAAIADDAVWAWNAADYDNCIFIHDIIPGEFSNDAGGPSWCAKVLTDFPLVAAGSQDLYVYIKNLNAVTPSGANNYHVRWLPDRD